MKKKLIVLVFLVLIVFILFPYYSFLRSTLHVSLLRTLLSLDRIDKVNDQVNFLILGIPGPGHDGPYLSDSIEFLNYDLKSNRLISIGIPRDVWSDSLDNKVNTAYAFGEDKAKGGGLKLAKAEVSSILGVP